MGDSIHKSSRESSGTPASTLLDAFCLWRIWKWKGNSDRGLRVDLDENELGVFINRRFFQGKMPTPKAQNVWIVRQYEILSPEQMGREHETARCLHCRSYERIATEISELKAHLLNRCPPYQRKLEAGELSQEDCPPELRQAQPPVARLSETEEERLHRLAALAIAEIGESFSLFEHPAMKAYLQALNPAHQPPDRHTIKASANSGSAQSLDPDSTTESS
ncbi:hypothetical protein SLS58_005795 [Diplodia intermedia]|uniref:Uncharacterized protein n=1 Tax=Diplodia intermedia TaxID=856260 RepID=A0ABR3TPG9_9PEZI